MRIATYNLWNSTYNGEQRLAAVVEELAFLDADIVAMQEAPIQATDNRPLIDFFRQPTSYEHAWHLEHPKELEEGGRLEGLALLSRLPFQTVRVNWEHGKVTANNWAVRGAVDCWGASMGITNVHLDWKQAANRDQHIVHMAPSGGFEAGVCSRAGSRRRPFGLSLVSFRWHSRDARMCGVPAPSTSMIRRLSSEVGE